MGREHAGGGGGRGEGVGAGIDACSRSNLPIEGLALYVDDSCEVSHQMSLELPLKCQWQCEQGST